MPQKNVSPLYIVIYKEGKRFSGTPGMCPALRVSYVSKSRYPQKMMTQDHIPDMRHERDTVGQSLDVM